MVPSDGNAVVSTEVDASSPDEPKILCIIRDMTDPSNCGKNILNLQQSCTVGQLLHYVGKQYDYDPDTFKLTYDTDEQTLEFTTNGSCCDVTLGQICPVDAKRKRHNFFIMETSAQAPRKLSPQSQDTELKEVDEITAVTLKSLKTVSYKDQELNSTSMFYPIVTDKSTGYVGLVNQAMTCYLNSLLQTLYMTPEFRNALYRWEYEGTEDDGEKNIPFQLQRLFLLLQTSEKKAIETTNLTRSFGWDSSEAWQQHDVQELCRVMFDALETCWRNTDQAHLINQLYQGKVKDYVECLECGYENSKVDVYLDLALPVRPFGSNKSYGSIMDAMLAYVQPELLEGSNQYYCERCAKKCDAHKGLKYVDFPYLLTLQMLRFDFDYSTLQHIKLNDKMTFPETLSLGHLLRDKGGGGDSNNEAAAASTSHPQGCQNDENEPLPEAEGSQDDENLHNTPNPCQVINGEESYTYELFSIMIHSGSAAGGHYYAYIKSFETGEWFCFNDQHVTSITQDDIRKTYGGGLSCGNYSSMYASSVNAYMLMYRRKDKQRNRTFTPLEELPPHIQSLLGVLKYADENEREKLERARSMCKIKLIYQDPVLGRKVDTKFEVHEHATLTDATLKAMRKMDLVGKVDLDCCRLVKYDEFHDSVEHSFSAAADAPMGQILGGTKTTYSFELLLQTKGKDETFAELKVGEITCRLHTVDIDNQFIEPNATIRTLLTQSVAEFKHQVAEVIAQPSRRLRCVLERTSALRHLADDTSVLKTLGFQKNNKVFVEYQNEIDAQKPFEESQLYSILDAYQNTIVLTVTLPTSDDVSRYLERLRVHTDLCNLIETQRQSKQQSVDVNVTLVPNEVGLDVGLDASDDVVSPQFSDDIVGDCASDIDVLDILNKSLSPEMAADLNRKCDATGEETADLKQTIGDLFDDAMANNPDQTGSGKHEEAGVNDSRRHLPNDDQYRPYLKVQLTSSHKGDRGLCMRADRRMSLYAIKVELESHVGASMDHFKMYRLYANGQEFEVVRLSDSMHSFADESKVVVKLGRALRTGEYRVKVFLLQVNESEPMKLLLESVVYQGMTVLESKQLFLAEIETQTGEKIALERCRLRKKNWRNPGAIYTDRLVYDEDIIVMGSLEVLLEVLDGPDLVTDPCTQMALYARHWSPSRFTLGPMYEIVLIGLSVAELVSKISAISGIPEDNVEIAKLRGTFPCDISLLDVHTGLEWSSELTMLDAYPMCITDHGSVIAYRDKTEQLMELSDEKNRQIQQRETIRLAKSYPRTTQTKERALKIYTDGSQSTSTCSSPATGYTTPTRPS